MKQPQIPDKIQSLKCWAVLKDYWNTFAFSIISWHWEVAESSDLSSERRNLFILQNQYYLQSTKFIFEITSPHLDVFYTPNVKITHWNSKALSDYYQHLAGQRVWMSWTDLMLIAWWLEKPKHQQQWYWATGSMIDWSCSKNTLGPTVGVLTHCPMFGAKPLPEPMLPIF